jgi:hypothetical protein
MISAEMVLEKAVQLAKEQSEKCCRTMRRGHCTAASSTSVLLQAVPVSQPEAQNYAGEAPCNARKRKHQRRRRLGWQKRS